MVKQQNRRAGPVALAKAVPPDGVPLQVKKETREKQQN
jgi:hypothetical protein